MLDPSNESATGGDDMTVRMTQIGDGSDELGEHAAPSASDQSVVSNEARADAMAERRSLDATKRHRYGEQAAAAAAAAASAASDGNEGIEASAERQEAPEDVEERLGKEKWRVVGH